jgi:hypothetical protein
MEVNKALCDLGSSIIVIPLSLLSKLNIREQKTAKTIELTLADNSIIKSHGIIEDVKDLIFPAYFVILDMKEDDEGQIFLGRPFLTTSSAFINMEHGEIHLKMGDKERNVQVYRVKRQECWKIDVREKEPKDVSPPSAQEDILKMQELGKEMAQWIPRHLMNLRDFYDVD